MPTRVRGERLGCCNNIYIMETSVRDFAVITSFKKLIKVFKCFSVCFIQFERTEFDVKPLVLLDFIGLYGV